MDYENVFNERCHIENTLNSRFNYFIAIFGVMIAGIIECENANQFQMILILGFLIELALSLTIVRAQTKLDCLLDWLIKNAAANINGNINPESSKICRSMCQPREVLNTKKKHEKDNWIWCSGHCTHIIAIDPNHILDL